MKLSMLKASLNIRPFYAQKSTVGYSIRRWNKNMTEMRNLLQEWGGKKESLSFSKNTDLSHRYLFFTLDRYF